MRVATWNIRAAIGPGEPFPAAWWRHVRTDRLEQIAAFIVALDPGQAAQSRAETGTVESEGATGNAVAGCGDRAARSDDERASLALLRERHKVT